jgi:uncharacterized phiE125 gp8 family phage protein
MELRMASFFDAPVLAGGDRDAAVAAGKALLRVTSGDEATLIGDRCETALGLAEPVLGQVAIARTITLRVPAAVEWQRLAATPVSAIGSVGGLDASGAAVALASDGYAIDIDADGDGWVRLTRHADVAALAVEVSAGMAADWASLPAAVRQGVAMLAAYLYDRRDGAGAPPAAVTALWRPYRRLRLADRVPA